MRLAQHHKVMEAIKQKGFVVQVGIRQMMQIGIPARAADVAGGLRAVDQFLNGVPVGRAEVGLVRGFGPPGHVPVSYRILCIVYMLAAVPHHAAFTLLDMRRFVIRAADLASPFGRGKGMGHWLLVVHHGRASFCFFHW
jgi:hypothetical protein